MAHTIFHDEQIREQVAQNTPRSTVEQARQRRIDARRRVFEAFTPPPATETPSPSLPGTTTSGGEGGGVRGQSGSSRTRSQEQFGRTGFDVVGAAANSIEAELGPTALGLAGALTGIGVLSSIAALPFSGLFMGLFGQTVGTPIGSFQQGMFSGNVDFRGIGGSIEGTPGSFGGGRDGEFGSASEVASAASFSDAQDFSEFGQDVNTSIGRDASDYGGDSGGSRGGVGDTGSGRGDVGDAGEAGGVGQGGGVGL